MFKMSITEAAIQIKHYLEFIRNLGYSHLTIRAYEGDLHQIFEVGTKNDTEAVSDNFWLFHALKAFKQNPDWTSTTRARKVATLKSFFRFLHLQEVTKTDFGNRLTTPRVSRKLPHYLSADEAITVLKNKECFDDNQGGRQKLMLFLLLYGGGLRVSEACFLRWADVHLEKRSAQIMGKGGKERIVVFPESVVSLLTKMESNAGTDSFVWGEQSLNTRTAYNWIREIGIRSGLERPLHPHMLRHSFATHILQSGGSLRAIQELLGHQSLAATERYTHLGLADLARTLEKFHPLERNAK